jgi:hypothetical protein
MRSSRLAARDQVNSDPSKQTFMKKRKASKRFPQLLCTEDNLVWKPQNNLAHILIDL